MVITAAVAATKAAAVAVVAAVAAAAVVATRRAAGIELFICLSQHPAVNYTPMPCNAHVHPHV